LAGERGLDHALGGLDVDAVPRQRVAIEVDLQLRDRGVAIELEVGDAADALERRLRLLERRAHRFEVGAEDLEHHLPAHAAHRPSTLSLIGCEKLKRTPGISVSDARIASTRPSLSSPGRHSAFGFRRTKVSLMLTPSSSVPSSGRPCSLSVFSTSGKASSRLRTSVRTACPSASEMLGGISTKITRSPSSSSRRNSVPSRVAPPATTASSASATTVTIRRRA